MSTQTISTTIHVTQPHLVITTPAKRTSNALCGFGVAEIVFSIFLFSSCIWSASIDSGILAAYFGFTCAIFHSILGILAIVAGRNLDHYRGCLVACLVMGIVGSLVFVLATVITDSIQWSNYKYNCWNCQYRQKNKYNDRNSGIFDDDYGGLMLRCVRRCMLPDGSLFFPILFFSIIDGIIGIILSWIACCNFSSCCTRQTQGIVNYGNNYTNHHQLNVPVLATQPQPSPQQIHVNYPPPNYSENADTNQSIIPGVHETNFIKF